MADEELAALIRKDRVAILVDLSGHTADDRLGVFARKPAAIQITWNGYANTTGMSAVDYRITDAYADPPGMTEHLHTEKLLRMPDIYMPCARPEEDLAAGPCPFSSRGYITFGSFNAISKLRPRMISIWGSILKRVPSARLLMMTVPQGRTRLRLLKQFEECGVDSRRIDMRGRLSHREFLAAFREADIALDTFPFHGTTTTAHTLWMGLPVVTLAGASHVSRVGVSMLSNVGLNSCIAGDESQYIELGVKLANDPERLTMLRQTLRGRMLHSPNMDGARFTGFLENTYVSMCKQRDATISDS
jgi:predicted O-linked N-acetylglucosamine transferase (SPINDLY family)